MPISRDPDVAELIRVDAAIRDLKIKYPRSSDRILVVGFDAVTLQRLQREQVELLRRVILKHHHHSDPCACGSGRKFRKCCREEMLRVGPV